MRTLKSPKKECPQKTVRVITLANISEKFELAEHKD